MIEKLTSDNFLLLYLGALLSCLGFLGAQVLKEWKYKSLPIKRDKELFNRLIEKFNNKNFIAHTRNQVWAGKFLYEYLTPFFEILDTEDGPENKFLNSSMERKRKKLIQDLKKLSLVLSRNFEICEPTSNGHIFRPSPNIYTAQKWNELNDLLDEVRDACIKISLSYESFYNSGHKKFGERVFSASLGEEK